MNSGGSPISSGGTGHPFAQTFADQGPRYERRPKTPRVRISQQMCKRKKKHKYL